MHVIPNLLAAIDHFTQFYMICIFCGLGNSRRHFKECCYPNDNAGIIL